MLAKISPVWKEAPFLRLITPLTAGILSGWHFHFGIALTWLLLGFSICILLLLGLPRLFIQFKYNWVKGILLNLSVFCLGLLLVRHNLYPDQEEQYALPYKNGDAIEAVLEEPPTARSMTRKVVASLRFIFRNDRVIKANSNILIYIQKDNLPDSLGYGSIVIFKKPVQCMLNSGNPGSFDYRRYCLFRNITGEVYLKKGEYIFLREKEESFFKKYLFAARQKIITILRTFLHGRKEIGLAEALLIGYRDDLDRDLVHSYTNTGVVHIIAISGLHLALIYWLLQFFLKPIPEKGVGKWVKPLILIGSLWIFAFLCGASPSVLRSAVMFSFIVIGKTFSKSGSIYNSLSASAFLLLCCDPFWLWDIGFQLSYSAVLSIVIFVKPISNWFIIKNKILHFVWKSASVSLAAQILTTPVSVYHFHQFPNYFLMSNLLAVPLSSLVLLGELLVCAVSVLPAVAIISGRIISGLIFFLNSFLEYIEALPLSVWGHLYISLFQLVFVYLAIAGAAYWLFRKNISALFIALIALLCFTVVRTIAFRRAGDQRILIVYNVPQRQAIDFMEGRKYFFKGDKTLTGNNSPDISYVQPARIMYRVDATNNIDYSGDSNRIFQFNSKKIMILEQNPAFIPAASKIDIDMIILSKNPPVSLRNLSRVFNCKLWIIDASNASGKILKWKKECERLGLAAYSIPDRGAFVLSID